ncbi:helix-turn-helix domain-containing protein [Nocardia sp. IFM 10818]
MSDLTPHVSARHRFGAELRRRRIQRGFSQAELGRRILHSASTVAKVETAQRWPSRDFAEHSDSVLGTGGELLRLWHEAHLERTDQQVTAPKSVVEQHLVENHPEIEPFTELLSRLVTIWMDLRGTETWPGIRALIIARLDADLCLESEY